MLRGGHLVDGARRKPRKRRMFGLGKPMEDWSEQGQRRRSTPNSGQHLDGRALSGTAYEQSEQRARFWENASGGHREQKPQKPEDRAPGRKRAAPPAPTTFCDCPSCHSCVRARVWIKPLRLLVVDYLLPFHIVHLFHNLNPVQN